MWATFNILLDTVVKLRFLVVLKSIAYVVQGQMGEDSLRMDYDTGIVI